LHFFTNLKIVDEAGTQSHTYDETFFYTTFRISFSYKYRTEKSAVQVSISASPFIAMRTVRETLRPLSHEATMAAPRRILVALPLAARIFSAATK
jgi:hypothetical protein